MWLDAEEVELALHPKLLLWQRIDTLESLYLLHNYQLSASIPGADMVLQLCFNRPSFVPLQTLSQLISNVAHSQRNNKHWERDLVGMNRLV